MYKLSCMGKSACFLLLVMRMVSILTCSGFRIDGSNSGGAPSAGGNVLTGEDGDFYSVGRRDSTGNQYPLTSGGISDNMDYINRAFQVRSEVSTSSGPVNGRTSNPANSFAFNSASSSPRPHRLRHRRSRQHHHHLKSETSPPYQLRSPPSNYDKELHPQHQHSQRPPPQQTPSANKKHHGNSKNRKNSNNNSSKRRKQHQPERDNDRHGKKASCQQQNVARKAHLANTVVLATALSMNVERLHNYSVTFRITDVYKKLYDVDSDIRLAFLNNTTKMNCETGDRRAAAGPVKAQIKPQKKYFLFLNSAGSHDYTVIGMPVLYKEKTLAVIKRVTNASFVPQIKAPTIKVLTAEDTTWNVSSSSTGNYLEVKPGQKIRLACDVQGFPIPLITWEKNDTRVTANNTRIIYRRKRAMLVIKKARPQDSGVYRCVAWYGADDRTTSSKHAQSPEIRISNSENNYGAPCSEKYNTTFCQNGGQCRVAEVQESVLFCICPDGFNGERCETKSVENSMYMQKTSCAENFMC